PDLKPWHEVDLEQDFHADMQLGTLAEYLEVESRAFAELDKELLDQIEPKDQFAFNRFTRGSYSDPDQVQPNWNRTYELKKPKARGGVLLLHGLSDSPYSLRSVGQQLHGDGWLVLGMRMPGHGTAPGAMRNFKRDDARAAVRIGMRHLREQIGNDRPIMIVGYSNGAALATDYVVTAISDSDLPTVDGLILMSPAFAVAPIAAFAVWQARIGELLGIDKLAWQVVTPEFDPYKYNSFAVRSGDQMYRFTQEIDKELLALQKSDVANTFPPTLVFQSVTDATVQPSAVVTRVLDRLAGKGSALVLYDVNRNSDAEQLYAPNVGGWVQERLANPTPYSVTLLTNRLSDSDDVEAVTRRPGASEVVRQSLEIDWPSNVFALSHVAIPFPPDDPVYGTGDDDGKLLNIGGIELRGETGVLAISATLLTRLRHNPFYPYQSGRIREFASQIAARHSGS
ncbi:MAG: alpha/beta fold hydrolase, partial [Betaproteobacteria bacterium]